MSAIALAPAPIASHLFVLVAQLFARKNSMVRSLTGLQNLPDYLLLDIGVDPRDVPNNLDEVITPPDIAHGALVAPVFRTTAKS